MTDFEGLLKLLHDRGVKFILVGGMAAIAHGAARVTYDLDISYERSPENIARLAGALKPLNPRLRSAPDDIPFLWDAETIVRGLNFTLRTSMGELDLLGEIAGGGGYQDLLPKTERIVVEGTPCQCISLEALIHVKRTAGRTKDREAVEELIALLEERAKQ